MKELDCIFIVFGNRINTDYSNVESINTKVIPNKGDLIQLKRGVFEVTDKIIVYTQVEDYDLDSPDRGGEIVYLMVKKA